VTVRNIADENDPKLWRTCPRHGSTVWVEADGIDIVTTTIAARPSTPTPLRNWGVDTVRSCQYVCVQIPPTTTAGFKPRLPRRSSPVRQRRAITPDFANIPYTNAPAPIGPAYKIHA